MKKIYFGDNLKITMGLSSNSVNLVYADPPFNSKVDYNKPSKFDSTVQELAFEDTHKNFPKALKQYEWYQKKTKLVNLETIEFLKYIVSVSDSKTEPNKFSIPTYLHKMTPILCELHRVLKPTGLIYLHCDTTANHYLKIIMNSIFGEENFRNEIIWVYGLGGIPVKDFARKHDIILRFVKDAKSDYTMHGLVNGVKEKRTEEVLRRQATGNPKATWSKGTFKFPTDIWEIPTLNGAAKERVGFPTQKPRELLKKIILSSSNAGDLFYEPFMGSGPGIKEAQMNRREWIGCDLITGQVIEIRDFLTNKMLVSREDFEVCGIPNSYDSAKELAQISKQEFEKFCNSLVGAVNTKYVGDGGIDGYRDFKNYSEEGTEERCRYIVQATGGEKVSLDKFKAFIQEIHRKNSKNIKFGIFISLNKVTKGIKNIEWTEQRASDNFKYRKRKPIEGDDEIKEIPIIQQISMGEYYSGIRVILPDNIENSFGYELTKNFKTAKLW